MDKHKGFLKTARIDSDYRFVCERVKDYEQVAVSRTDSQSKEQASRCMDCGTPFCHSGCPIGNYIPEWNDYMFRGMWKEALLLLSATNTLPEITGRVCPALCEYSCVLGLNDDAVTIRENELAVIEHGFAHDLVKPYGKINRTGKKVAIVGSGPAGLTCASQLNRAGHAVTVFERDKKLGGILRYGIPDFKLEKNIIDRRLDVWKEEGVVFKTGTEVGKDYPKEKLLKEFDAVCLAGGSRVPRDLNIKGRELEGIYFAMDYLTQSNKKIAGEKIKGAIINASGKRVVVIGGGDTGSDCVGTAHRQSAVCVTQIEVMDMPSECRGRDYPWPSYPLILKTSSSHKEGGERHWSVLTKKFIGSKGRVEKISCVKVSFDKTNKNACPVMKEIKGSEFEIDVDMVVLAIGFLHPEQKGLLSTLGIEYDARGNVKTSPDYMTTKDGIFAAGDIRRGQSLVVWAIAEGLHCAYNIDKYLMGESNLAVI
ncbi:MAG: glutamate synthase subunit beta [Candidatus Orphnella occulta]|nr:glutamate synthase subunit beta [Candidatus Orphnella occulta]